MSKSDEAIPRSVDVLWKRANSRRRGSQPILSLDRIVAAAIDIADAEGLSALSMARIAKRLGSGTMSLYRHVANKDELQVFMMDAAPGPPPVIKLGRRGWRQGLARWAHELRSVYYRHPWILLVTTGRPPLEPGQLAWLDCGLRTLKAARLSPDERMSVILLVLNYVRGEAQIRTGLLQNHKSTPAEERRMQEWYGRALATLVDVKRFPALSELSTAGVFGPDRGDGAADFDFGLARLLDGVAAFVKGRGR
jgi:AcrR family transcriptional regulator